MTPTDSRALAYTTIADDVEIELEIKRSRFLAHLRRVESEEAARGLVAEHRRDHHDARHHCSAFVLGPDRDTQRSSDDGEPAGTAGVPMLEALTLAEVGGRQDLSDVAAVVTRYFGGVKLGAGGLVRAYSEAVSQAVSAATPLRRERRRIVALDLPVAAAGRAESVLRQGGLDVVATRYTAASATLRLTVCDEASALDAVARTASGLLAREVELVREEAVWVDR